MTSRKIFMLCMLFNMAWLALFVGVFAWTQPARASTPLSAPSAPSAPTIGPFYESYSAADFQNYEDGLGSFITRRSGYALVKDSSFGIAVTGVHLPPGASITQLSNDSAANENGKTQLRLFECTAFNSCSQIALAEQNIQGRHMATSNVTIPTDSQNKSYFLQIDLPDDSGFYNAFIGYTLPSTFLFMPAVLR